MNVIKIFTEDCKTCPCHYDNYGDTHCRIVNGCNEMQGGKLDNCPVISVDVDKIKAAIKMLDLSIQYGVSHTEKSKEVIKEALDEIDKLYGRN